ncbi:D-ribose pyranase [Suicoccus acidiformans]|uniref:D-ribose pyranase n=1 Tax=Suicoccus acidiformans TaxID=2036206 RepID=A0A347WIP1_9LACT|nr:D-ribose pyranase [Suicoccus acidiformans]AXY24948.1 D-ribose pyranase [Suicoccus acidiformans]
MKKHGILNSEISTVLSQMGHTDQLTIGDCGLPIPDEVKRIDLALKAGKPSFIEVLSILLEDMHIEKVILAEEIKLNNKDVHRKMLDMLPDDIDIEYVSHETFKSKTSSSKAIIRTGEITPFSNIILQSNVFF